MIVWRRLLGLWDTEQSDPKSMLSITEIADQARRDWIDAQRYFNTVTDPDLIDYALYNIKACERKYIYLLKKIRAEGLKHPGISIDGITEQGTVRQAL